METTKAFPSKITMLQYLAKRVEGLDLNASAFAPRFSFSTLAGEHFNCPNSMTFVQDFNKTFGDLLDPNGCRTVGGGRGKCILTFLDKIAKSEPVVKTIIKEEVIIVEPEVVALAPSEDSLQADTEIKFDLAYATSLQEGKSNKEAKDSLECYGRTLSIELNKKKSYKNMLIELQEAL